MRFAAQGLFQTRIEDVIAKIHGVCVFQCSAQAPTELYL